MTSAAIDLILALTFFGGSALIALMTLVRLLPLRLTQRRMARTPGLEGPSILARVWIRERLLYFWISGVFVIVGVLQLLPHVRYDAFFWIGTIAVFSILVRLYQAIRATDRDEEAAYRASRDPR